MKRWFAEALQRYGPTAHYAVPSRAEAADFCRRLARSHYENFSVATLLLPRKLVPHFHAIYAYCRWADDLGDETGDRAPELLAWWREELLKAYAGSPKHPILVALMPTVRRFAIPPTPFLDLLVAFEQDQTVKRYDSYEQLLGYCRNSADPVGRLLLYLCESFDAERVALSDAICTALQLANFWQDVGRDLDIGRVYLPAEDRRFFGYADADLEARRFTPSFRELMRFEIDRTRRLFQQGLPLVARMPRPVQADIELFARGGLAILAKIEAQDCDVWRARPRLSKRDKAMLIGRAVCKKTWTALWG
jgi:squalene synthase HpnC